MHGYIIHYALFTTNFYQQELGTHGKSAFYNGRIAKALVDVVRAHGGVMSLEDLQNHETTFDDPISVDYKGHRVWEIPPNGQGITALMTLNILEQTEKKSKIKGMLLFRWDAQLNHPCLVFLYKFFDFFSNS